MKINLSYYLFLIFVLFQLFSCKKEEIKAVPSLTVAAVANITATSATCGGEVTADGGSAVTSRGICWSSTNLTPTTSDSKTFDGIGLGIFTSSLIGLTPGTKYYLRVYATNSVGTAYYSQSSFITLTLASVLTTTNLSAITSSTATSGGNITSDGGSPVTTRGVCWSMNQNPTIADGKTIDGTGSGSFTSSITGLTAGVTYYFRAYATNSIGTAYGNQVATITQESLPVLTTTSVTIITSTTAKSGGNITSDGGTNVNARGVCWNTLGSPTIANNKTSDGTGKGSFTSTLTNLTTGTLYFVRSYATNRVGTTYGNQVSFTKITGGGIGTVTDIEGNVYHTILIGTQLWMAENLKTTKYNDGTSIPNVIDSASWRNVTTPGYCWYNNDIANKNTFGGLYNWFTVNTGKLCPIGWHVPSDAEWKQLEMALGMTQFQADAIGWRGTDQGKQLKATSGWSLNGNGTNTSGFMALPAGSRAGFYGFFGADIGNYSYWWSSTECTIFYSWCRKLHTYQSDVSRDNDNIKQSGLSVRCISD